MLYSSAELEIKTHRKVAMELLTRPTARLLWQPDLERAILMEGEAGQTGAVTAMVFGTGTKQRRVIETILRVDPHSSLHLVQVSDTDEYRLHYGFINVRPGYIKVSLTIEIKPSSALDTMKGLFDKKLKTLAAEHLQVLNEYVIQRNFRRKIRRARRRAATES